MDQPLKLQAKLLIATPQLQDPNFEKAVILILNHTSDGAFGLVINRKTSEKWKKQVPVWYGGPCEPERLWLLHETDSGFELTNDLEQSLDSSRAKIFSGYSGWVEGQLDMEIAVSSWLEAPLQPDLVLETPPDQIWEKAILSLGLDPSNLSTQISRLLH